MEAGLYSARIAGAKATFEMPPAWSSSDANNDRKKNKMKENDDLETIIMPMPYLRNSGCHDCKQIFILYIIWSDRLKV